MFEQISTRLPDINELRERLIKVLENSPEPLYKRCKEIGIHHRTVLDFLHQRRKVYWKTVYKLKDFIERAEKRMYADGFIDIPTNEAIKGVDYIKGRCVVFFEKTTWELVATKDEAKPFLWKKIETELAPPSPGTLFGPTR